MKKNKKYFLSLIIPAFKQEKTIKNNILKIKEAVDRINCDYEIIVVVDGKIDKTFENAKKVKSENIAVIGYESNHGKGYAIRYGMTHSKGDIVGFIDAGMELNPDGLSLLLENFKWKDADVIIGSKLHPESKVNYPLNRKIISFFSQSFIRMLFGLNVRDTQVGMKLFKREVIKNVLPKLLVKKFAFDIEILVVSYYFGYNKIFEAPIELHFDFENSIISQSLISTIFRTLWDTMGIFYRLKIIHYYDKIKKK